MDFKDLPCRDNMPVNIYEGDVKWYVMRDLKRANDKNRAYKVLKDANFEVFTPLVQKIELIKGKRVRIEVPFIADLLFVHTTKALLDPIVNKIKTLQYRYIRGGKQYERMTVDNASMDKFIKAIKNSTRYRLFNLSEIPHKAIDSYIKIIGGPLDGCEGNLLKIQGSRKKRLLVSIDNIFSAAIEIEPEFIRIESTENSKTK